jgi:hypothetical protein
MSRKPPPNPVAIPELGDKQRRLLLNCLESNTFLQRLSAMQHLQIGVFRIGCENQNSFGGLSVLSS